MIRIHDEVASAIQKGRGVVALESSVIAQGLPAPHNLSVAMRCEEVIRQEGACPATIAVIDGVIHVGLSAVHISRLSQKAERFSKVSSRDLAVVVSKRLSGGTTVSATMEIAARVGIHVFSTGGIGGVHRGNAEDVSQDLPALAKFPVAVVCAGAKSILDLPRTLEQLETLGVPVVGVGTDDFPGFFVRGTGLPLEYHVDNASEAAEFLKIRIRDFGQGGMVVALPPPEATALSSRVVDRQIKDAMIQARKKGIRGKEVTPFLLRQLVTLSKGKTLKANVALLVENARFAAKMAVHFSALDRH